MSDVLKNLPDPKAVREQLGANVREARILRKLIKVAEEAEAERRSPHTSVLANGSRRAAAVGEAMA